MDYQIDPLGGSRIIRLITLRPGNWEEEVSISVDHTSLDQIPEYEALSCFLGSQHMPNQIKCGNDYLDIGAGLEDALRHLRKEDSIRTFWVDTLAIPQSDDDELTQKFSLQEENYRSASGVIVWFGVSDAHTEAAFHCIHQIGSGGSNYWQQLHFHLPQQQESTKATQLPIQLPSLAHPIWSSLEAMLQGPYFRTMWHLQEMVWAHNVELKHGVRSLSWARIQAFVTGLQSWTNDQHLRVPSLKRPSSYASNLLQTEQMYAALSNLSPPLDIYKLASRLKNRQRGCRWGDFMACGEPDIERSWCLWGNWIHQQYAILGHDDEDGPSRFLAVFTRIPSIFKADESAKRPE